MKFLAPLDQPRGRDRLLESLRRGLLEPQFTTLLIAVAFAKAGPLVRLEDRLTVWRQQGKRVEAIVGIDQGGTSREALGLALQHFTTTYVLHACSISSFHPKIYLFIGATAARAFVGSHNLTVGGTETNFESGIQLDLSLPADSGLLGELTSAWTALRDLPATRQLDGSMLDRLTAAGLLFEEAGARSGRQARAPRASMQGQLLHEIFGDFRSVPPSSIPARKIGSAAVRERAGGSASLVPTVPADAFVIQITPHPNGEVFLSKQAADQNPQFFEYPFTGWTVPKRSSNRPYPQRIPDPVVSITIYGADGNVIHRVEEFNLNTVYYSVKSEIRVTFSTSWLHHVAHHSLLVMRKSDPNDALDYELEIYHPDSAQFAEYIERCDQVLPTGGSPVARRMGWL